MWLKRTLFAFVAFLFLFTCFSRVALAESEPAKSTPKLAGPAKDTPAWSGLFLGRIISVDPKYRYLFVKPLEGNARRRSFYLDRRTLYREKRKQIPKTHVLPGRKVGIRYVRENDIAYAEGVFLFDKDINPREFEMPKKKVEKKEGAEGEKPAGHGEAKKAEAAPAKKPASGGHH